MLPGQTLGGFSNMSALSNSMAANNVTNNISILNQLSQSPMLQPSLPKQMLNLAANPAAAAGNTVPTPFR